MTSAWLEIHDPRPGAALRLFCFPHAGGSALAYRNWGKRLPEWIEVCPIQYPGRWARFTEKPIENAGDMVTAAFEGLQGELGTPFAFFGHSMGAIIAYEVSRRLQSTLRPSPEALIVSAVGAPQDLIATAKREMPPSDSEIISRVRALAGTPEDLLNHPEMMELMLPILRADFSVVDSYRFVPGEKLKIPIFAFSGAQDEAAPASRLAGWGQQTEKPCQCFEFPGGHFYLSSEEDAVLGRLEAILKNGPSRSGV